MNDVELLPQELRARSIDQREIVLNYTDVQQAIDLLEAARWACLGWEGWLHYADGTNGFAWEFPGPAVDPEPEEPWDVYVHRSASLCRATIEDAQQRWRVQPERRDADLFYCLTAGDRIELL
jgi:hypothetical protein